jgi:hypothetical protein
VYELFRKVFSRGFLSEPERIRRSFVLWYIPLLPSFRHLGRMASGDKCELGGSKMRAHDLELTSGAHLGKGRTQLRTAGQPPVYHDIRSERIGGDGSQQ